MINILIIIIEFFLFKLIKIIKFFYFFFKNKILPYIKIYNTYIKNITYIISCKIYNIKTLISLAISIPFENYFKFKLYIINLICNLNTFLLKNKIYFQINNFIFKIKNKIIEKYHLFLEDEEDKLDKEYFKLKKKPRPKVIYKKPQEYLKAPKSDINWLKKIKEEAQYEINIQTKKYELKKTEVVKVSLFSKFKKIFSISNIIKKIILFFMYILTLTCIIFLILSFIFFILLIFNKIK
jgi:hypothetical protein